MFFKHFFLLLFIIKNDKNMALMESILLQISQNKTKYNDLLLKIRPNYSSEGSARAALSRALKNLIAFGEITKTNDFYELTEKGKQIVENKLKNPNLAIINDLLNKTKGTNLTYVDEIIKNIHIYLEKAKIDPSLLKMGKTGATFYISDLENIKKLVDKQISNYTHLSETLQKQINTLQEQNFEDAASFNLDEDSFEYIYYFCKIYNINELIIDCAIGGPETISFFEKHSKFTKKGETTFILKTENIADLKKILFESFENTMNLKFKIYLEEIIIKVEFGRLYITGPYNQINKIKIK